MEKQMCPLCGKQRSEGLISATIGEVDDGVFLRVDVCQSCHTVLHNTRRIYEDKKKEFLIKKAEQSRKEVNSFNEIIEGHPNR